MLHSLQQLAKEEFRWFFLWHFLLLSEIDQEQADKKKGERGLYEMHQRLPTIALNGNCCFHMALLQPFSDQDAS